MQVGHVVLLRVPFHQQRGLALHAAASGPRARDASWGFPGPLRTLLPGVIRVVLRAVAALGPRPARAVPLMMRFARGAGVLRLLCGRAEAPGVLYIYHII